MTTDQSRWLFSKEFLHNTPSRKCGIDYETELEYRQHAAQLIQCVGQKLKVSAVTICTAIVYMHRFYVFHSFKQFSGNAIAACALFLSAKVEEELRKLEYVIRACHDYLNPNGPSLSAEALQRQADTLVTNENIMLQTLGFDIIIKHPHIFVVEGCAKIRASKTLSKTSYVIANKTLLLTTMCLQYPPTVIACFCIYFAHKWADLEIPQSNEGRDWFFYIDQTVTEETLKDLTSEFLTIFERLPASIRKKILSGGSAPSSSLSGFNHLLTSTSSSNSDGSRRSAQLNAGSEHNHLPATSSSNSEANRRSVQPSGISQLNHRPTPTSFNSDSNHRSISKESRPITHVDPELRRPRASPPPPAKKPREEVPPGSIKPPASSQNAHASAHNSAGFGPKGLVNRSQGIPSSGNFSRPQPPPPKVEEKKISPLKSETKPKSISSNQNVQQSRIPTSVLVPSSAPLIAHNEASKNSPLPVEKPHHHHNSAGFQSKDLADRSQGPPPVAFSRPPPPSEQVEEKKISPLKNDHKARVTAPKQSNQNISQSRIPSNVAQTTPLVQNEPTRRSPIPCDKHHHPHHSSTGLGSRDIPNRSQERPTSGSFLPLKLPELPRPSSPHQQPPPRTHSPHPPPPARSHSPHHNPNPILPLTKVEENKNFPTKSENKTKPSFSSQPVQLPKPPLILPSEPPLVQAEANKKSPVSAEKHHHHSHHKVSTEKHHHSHSHKHHKEKREKEKKHKKHKHEKHKEKDKERSKDDRRHSKDKEKYRDRPTKEERDMEDQDSIGYPPTLPQDDSRSDEDQKPSLKLKISKSKLNNSESESDVNSDSLPSFRIVIPKDRLSSSVAIKSSSTSQHNPSSSSSSARKRRSPREDHFLDHDKRFKPNKSDSSD